VFLPDNLLQGDDCLRIHYSDHLVLVEYATEVS
jgi:hypothetical protein